MIHFHIEDSLLILHWITIIEINLEITLERKEEDTFLYGKFKIWNGLDTKDVQNSK